MGFRKGFKEAIEAVDGHFIGLITGVFIIAIYLMIASAMTVYGILFLAHNLIKFL